MCAVPSIERISPYTIRAELDRPFGFDQSDSVPFCPVRRPAFFDPCLQSLEEYPAGVLICARLCSCFRSGSYLGLDKLAESKANSRLPLCGSETDTLDVKVCT
jgi:hypothetical protein